MEFVSLLLPQHDLVFLFSKPNLISNYNELTQDTFDHCNHQLHTALHPTLLLQHKNASRKGISISYINQILIEKKITFLYEISIAHRKSIIETYAIPFPFWSLRAAYPQESRTQPSSLRKT